MNRNLLALLAFIAVGLLNSFSYATDPVTYYLRTDGSDANSGLTNTSAGAWKTLAKVNRTTLNAGDVVHLGTGVFGSAQNDTTLVVPSSGSAGSPITFSGQGADKTVITGGMPLKGWMKSYDVKTDSTNQRPFRSGIAYGPDTLTVAGRTGMNFDGVDDYIDLGPDPIGTGDFTWFGWMRPTSTKSAPAIFSNTEGDGAAIGICARLTTNGSISVYSNSAYARSSANAIDTTGVWQHVIIAVHDSTVNMYVKWRTGISRFNNWNKKSRRYKFVLGEQPKTLPRFPRSTLRRWPPAIRHHPVRSGGD